MLANPLGNSRICKSTCIVGGIHFVGPYVYTVCVCLVICEEGDREKGVRRVGRAFVHITRAATQCLCIHSLGLPPTGSLHSPACF